MKNKEFVIYIHGVEPQVEGHSHRLKYEMLHRGISEELEDDPRYKAWHHVNVCMTEWGWNAPGSGSLGNHRRLTEAQQRLGTKVLDEVKKHHWLPLDLQLVFRQLTLFGFADIFYYVSTDGKRSIRAAVSKQIADGIGKALHDDETLISLTFVGHSAGSVIAFDLAYYLFSNMPTFIQADNSPDTHAGDMRRQAKVMRETHYTISSLQKLQKAAQDGRLRLRRMITFGSPIAMLAYRNDSLVELFADGKQISPVLHGLTRNPRRFRDSVKGPRWINIWDKDDPISFPLAPLFDNPGQKVIRDFQVNTSSVPFRGHTTYWASPKVHRLIARYW